MAFMLQMFTVGKWVLIIRVSELTVELEAALTTSHTFLLTLVGCFRVR